MKLEIYGGNLAAFVVASKSLRRDIEVTMRVKGGLKSHFSGLKFRGASVDRGMVLLEPPPDGVIPLEISLYDGEHRGTARPFVHNVFDWMMERQLSFHEVEIKTLFRQKIYNDIFIGDCLDLLQDLSRSESQTAIGEVRRNQTNLSKSEQHPRHKNFNPWFGQNSFLRSSCATSGETITGLIFEPLLLKIHGAGKNSLIANEHRSSWLPIYFPETVLAALTESNYELKPTKFLYPSNQSVADFVDEIIREMNENCLIQQDETNESTHDPLVFVHEVDATNIYFGGLPRTSLPNPIFSQGRIVYLPCEASIDQTFFIIDSDWAAFRLNVRGQSPHLDNYVCVEYGYSSSDISDEDLINEAKSLSDFLRLPIQTGECAVISARYPLRNADLTGVKRDLDSYRELMLRHGTMGFPITDLNNSFNDQLCAGLKVFDQLSTNF